MHREKINALRITKNIRKESHFKIKYFEHEMHENKLKIIKIKKKISSDQQSKATS